MNEINRIPVPASPILVTDDNPIDLFFLQRRLAAAGVDGNIQHVSSGSDAIRVLEAALTHHDTGSVLPWLMFLDLKMPGIDGFEVLKWMREHGVTEHVTIAVLSTSDEPRDIERSFRLGAHRYLVKYPQPAELIDVVTFAVHRLAHRPAAGPTPWIRTA